MTELKKYECHCHMDADGNSPVFYLATDVDALVGRLVQQLGRLTLKNAELYARLEPGFVGIDPNGNAHFVEPKIDSK